MKYEWMSGNEPMLGSNIRNILRLLIINYFIVHPKYYYRLFMTFLISWLLFPFRIIQSLKFNHKIKNTEITIDPIFIIGVWRTGTTFLHYLMTLDKQFGCQTNILTYMPHAGMLTNRFVRKLVAYGLPEKRPMDNVKLTINKPGEEDFALALESHYSFYHTFIFPKRMRYFSKFLTFNECKPNAVKRWKKRYFRLVKKITLTNNGKPLILKNPPNTARIKLLKELFPSAKFIYLYREPYSLYSSTIHLYKKLLPRFSYQKWNEEKTKENILKNFVTIQEEYEKSKEILQENELIEINYEQLIKEPLEKLKMIYEKLELTGYEKNIEKFQRYLDEQKDFETNLHNIEKTIIDDVNNNWDNYREKYGFRKKS